MARDKLYFACTYDSYNGPDKYTKETMQGVKRFYAAVKEVPKMANILSYLPCECYAGKMVGANYFPTRAEAQRVVDLWNESYRKNGTYAF